LTNGFRVFQLRHNAKLFALPVGISIRVTSRLIDVRRFRDTWLQKIHTVSHGKLLARDYSTGIFSDLNGHPTTRPSEMMEDIRSLPPM
jgi:acyl-CoA thioesterase FadM